MKKIMLGILLLLLLSACSKNGNSGAKERVGEAPINLIYYTIGWEDEDLELVNEEMNRLLEEKIGIHVEYNKIGWNDYEQKLTTILSSGMPVDIAFAYEYPKQAREGVWLALDDYLLGDYRVLYDMVNPLLWEGVTMADGHIYGIPTNKEVSVQEHWMYPRELVERYNIDISQYTTLASLEPLLQRLAVEEPDYLLMELDNRSHIFYDLYGYENIVDFRSPFAVKIGEEPLRVVNLFETPETEDILLPLRKYYQAGYINSDAALRQSQSLERDHKTFWKQASGGVYSANAWSRDRNYELVSFEVSPLVVTSGHTTAAVMAVSASTRYPEECMDFLTLLNTDPPLRNLLNYGIVDRHYLLDENEQVEFIGSDRYHGVQYTQGNWFILYTAAGDPLDKWEVFQQKNAEAIRSPLLGFTPDVSEYEQEMRLIHGIWDKYFPCLMTGSVDVEVELPKFLEELEQAGMEDITRELQRQLDAWLLQKEKEGK